MAGNMGTKPVFDSRGRYIGPVTRDLMVDPEQMLEPREALTQGCGKAHRQVVYAHFEFRNYRRSYLGETGKVVT